MLPLLVVHLLTKVDVDKTSLSVRRVFLKIGQSTKCVSVRCYFRPQEGSQPSWNSVQLAIFNLLLWIPGLCLPNKLPYATTSTCKVPVL
jgi:hypothetical protein